MQAVQCGDRTILQLLADNTLFGRDGNGLEGEPAVPAANLRAALPDGKTALMMAAQTGPSEDDDDDDDDDGNDGGDDGGDDGGAASPARKKANAEKKMAKAARRRTACLEFIMYGVVCVRRWAADGRERGARENT